MRYEFSADDPDLLVRLHMINVQRHDIEFIKLKLKHGKKQDLNLYAPPAFGETEGNTILIRRFDTTLPPVVG